MFVMPAVVGVGVGIMSGMLGIGGGTVLVPVFRLAFGMDPLMSTATSLFTIIPTSVSGAVAHIRHKTCVPSLGIAAGLGGACTSPIGVWLAQLSPAWMVMVAAAGIVGYSAFTMVKKAWKMKPGQVAPSSEAQTCADREEGTPPFSRLSVRHVLIGVGIGLGAGLASGYVGVGGGFIMVPLMVSLRGISMKLASGTSLIAVMILAIPAVIEQGILGNINYTAGIAIAVGSIPGAVLGARLVRLVPERTLRFVFGGFLIIAAGLMVLNEFALLA